MAAVADEPLREVTGYEETHRLLQALRRDLPHSVHAVGSVETLTRWRRQGLPPHVRCAVYRAAEEGDSTHAPATVVTVLHVHPDNNAADPPLIVLHSTDPACAALRRALRRSAHVPWLAPGVIFEGVHERCLPHLFAEMRALVGDDAPPPRLRTTHKLVLDREAALALDVSPPPGMALRPLGEQHAELVNRSWPYGSQSTVARIRETLRQNGSLCRGLFLEGGEDEPVAFVLQQWYGGLGILHTMDGHRWRGLGSLVLRAACRAVAEAEEGLLHANIVYPNPASDATLQAVGFRRVAECVWVRFGRQPASLERRRE